MAVWAVGVGLGNSRAAWAPGVARPPFGPWWSVALLPQDETESGGSLCATKGWNPGVIVLINRPCAQSVRISQFMETQDDQGDVPRRCNARIREGHDRDHHR